MGYPISFHLQEPTALEVLSSLLFSSLIVNKSSVKLWDSGQDSCSFENVNWPKFVLTLPYSTYTISEPLVKSNQLMKDARPC